MNETNAVTTRQWLPVAALLITTVVVLSRMALRLGHNFQPKTTAELLPMLVGVPLVLIFYAVKARREANPVQAFFRPVAVNAAVVCAALMFLPR